MFIHFFILAAGMLNVFTFFKKKLLALLMLELSFVGLIILYFFSSFGSLGDCSIFSMMVFLGFLVMDSVLGLCILILTGRNSQSFADPFFGL